jgi:hypothetical protein
MTSGIDDEPLLQRLESLRAAAQRIRTGDRRLILALRNDIHLLRAALHRRSDELAGELRLAGTKSRAVSAYSRTATLAIRSSTPE